MARRVLKIKKPEKYDEALRVAINVQWGDQDAFQHLNNVIYLRYFETARIAYMGQTGWLDNKRVLPILKSCSIDFIKQVTFPETLQLYSCVIDQFPKGVVVGTLFENSKGEAVAAAKATTLSFDYVDQKTILVPDSVVKYIEEVDKYQLPHVREKLMSVKW
jgi:acyl-CoA thioester hydrolase